MSHAIDVPTTRLCGQEAQNQVFCASTAGILALSVCQVPNRNIVNRTQRGDKTKPMFDKARHCGSSAARCAWFAAKASSAQLPRLAAINSMRHSTAANAGVIV